MQQPRVEVVQQGRLWMVEAEAGEQPQQQPEQQRQWRVGPFPSPAIASKAAQVLRCKLRCDGGGSGLPAQQPGVAAPEAGCVSDEEVDEDLQQVSLAELVGLLQEHAVTTTPGCAAPRPPHTPHAAVRPTDVAAAGPGQGSDAGREQQLNQLQQEEKQPAAAAPSNAKAKAGCRHARELPGIQYTDKGKNRYQARLYVTMPGQRSQELMLALCATLGEAAVLRDVGLLWRRMQGREPSKTRTVAFFLPASR